uniref:Mab-21-like HhH/H2TH-like domain-containing protein n=1 Tax=Clytia hemisphaerica TaxID=252671 RepID=A0A7M5VG66_9CNID
MEYKPLAKQEDSAFLFPTTIRRFLAGSRAERLFIESSDYDFIYEVGPGMVTPDFKEGQEECRFYCTPTMNIGFYYVFDSNKQKLSPATLQAKMFAQIMDPIKAEKPLYLVCKSHPSSSDENKDYEWRLSFSVLEIEIAKLINDNLRRSYLMCKHLLAKTKLLRFPRKCHVKSYELKTVFMWLSRELDTFEGQEYDQVELILTIFQRLLQHYEEQNLPNFFVPRQNILDTNKEEKMIEGRKFLKKYFSDEYNIAQLIEILGKN